jgi:hypothetical protein
MYIIRGDGNGTILRVGADVILEWLCGMITPFPPLEKEKERSKGNKDK